MTPSHCTDERLREATEVVDETCYGMMLLMALPMHRRMATLPNEGWSGIVVERYE